MDLSPQTHVPPITQYPRTRKKKSRTDAERSTSQDQVERAGRAVELRGEASTSSTTAQPTRKKTAAEEKYDQIQEERVSQP